VLRGAATGVGAAVALSGPVGAQSGDDSRRFLEEPAVPLPAETAITIHPSPFSDVVAQLGQNPGEWATVREHAAAVERHPQSSFYDFDTAAGRQLATVLAESGLPMGVEALGPMWADEPFDDGMSTRAVDRTLENLSAMRSVGIEPAYLNVDGPFKTSVRGTRPELEDRGFETFERAASELVDYVLEMRAEVPDLGVRVITNFPNWRWKGAPSITGADWGDYHDALTVLVDAFRSRGVPLTGIMVDHPSGYGHVERLFDLRDEVRARDLEFHVIVNSESGQRSGEAFARETYAYLLTLQRAGLDPDGYNVESWYEYPQQNVPETDDATMSGLVRAALELREGPPDPGKPVASITQFGGGTLFAGETSGLLLGVETRLPEAVDATLRLDYPADWGGPVERSVSFDPAGDAASPHRERSLSVETDVPASATGSGDVTARLSVDGAVVDDATAPVSVVPVVQETATATPTAAATPTPGETASATPTTGGEGGGVPGFTTVTALAAALAAARAALRGD
jgi:hypothetical protein